MGRGSRGLCAAGSFRLRLADNLYGNDLVAHVRFLRKKQRLLATLANPWTDSNFLYPEIKGLQDLVAAPSASQAAQDGLYGIVHQCARDIEGLLNATVTAASVGEGVGTLGECRGVQKWLNCVESMRCTAVALQAFHAPASRPSSLSGWGSPDSD
jgi:hypothetical protein